MRLHFVCVGGNKCGTTWLYEMLRQHPDLAVARTKEPHFFSVNYDRGLDWYRSHWQDDEGFRGELSTDYLYDELALERLAADFPDVRLLVLLRHPLERAISHFRHLLRSKRVFDVGEYLRDHPEIVENSLYEGYLRQLEDLFAVEQVRVLFFDDVRERPLRLLQEAFGHLGVADGFVPEGYSEPVGKGFTPRSRVLERGRMLIYRFLRNRGLHGVVRAVKASGLTNWYRSLNDEGVREDRHREIREALSHHVKRMRRDLALLEQSSLLPDGSPVRGWKESLEDEAD